MNKPSECKWCGCGSVHSASARHVKFTCRSAWTADGDCWACSSQCCDGMRDRIQRAVEAVATLQALHRYEVTPYSSRQVSWERTSDGPWILQREVETVVDDLMRVLEGET